MIARSVVVAATAAWLVLSGCDRASPSEPITRIDDEPPSLVERPDAGANWCAAHNVLESRCARCAKQRALAGKANTCDVATLAASSCAAVDQIVVPAPPSP